MTIVIRTMLPNDVPCADSLRAEAGWNQLPEDWTRLLSHEPQGCFVATLNDDVVGSVTTTRYGSELAWIGMMLVRESYRGRGIGKNLMQRALEYLEAQSVKCIRLDATPLGRPLYEKLGFVPEWEFHRWKSDHRTVEAATHREELAEGATEAVENSPKPQALLAKHQQLDTAAFGTDRSEWTARLAAISRCVTCDDGFGMLRDGTVAQYLGPITSATAATAGRICRSLLHDAEGPIFWDVPEVNVSARELAMRMGFVPARPLLRMRLGTTTTAPQVAYQFAIADPATG